MKKIFISLLSILFLLTSCGKDTPTEPDPNPDTEKEVISETYPIDFNEVKDLALDLRLNINSNNQSEVVAKAINLSDKVIKSIRINVDFLDEDVSRVMYMAQTVAPDDESLNFLIAGPKSNQAEDVVITDVIITYADGSTNQDETANVDKPDTDKPETEEPDSDKPATNEPDTDKPETDDSQEVDQPIAVDSSLLFELPRFDEEYILQMSDISPTLAIAEGKLVATFVNQSEFPIERYSLSFDYNGQSYTMTTEKKVDVSALSSQFGLLNISNVNLNEIKIKSLKVIASYENNQKLNVDYTIDPLSSTYTITY